MEENLPVVVEEKKEDDIREDLLQDLTVLEQRYCQLKVGSTFTDAKLAGLLGVNVRKIKKIAKKEAVKEMIKYQQRVVLANDIENVATQRRYLRENMFEEMASRFEEPDEDLMEDMSPQERSTYLKRFAKNAEFKDIVKAYETVDKVANLSNPSEDQVDTDQFVEQVRMRAEKRMRLIRERQESFDSAGFKEEDLFQEIVFDENGVAIPPEKQKGGKVVEEYEEVVTYDVSILKKDNKDG